MNNYNDAIYHLVPAGYYRFQPQNEPYRPELFESEGFIHCTAGEAMLLRVANAYFLGLAGSLLVLQIDSRQLSAPLKFEPPIPAAQSEKDVPTYHKEDALFPHIYGPLNRNAIIATFALRRDESGRWQMPE